MLRPTEVREHLDLLGLSVPEAARLLDVGVRTARRWTQPDEHGDAQPIPGPAEQALRAWLRLHRLGLSWRPDAQALSTNDAQSGTQPGRAHAIRLDAALNRVRERGGPAAPWDVDVARGCAKLGPLRVTFCRRVDGGFWPQSYSRADGAPDLERGITRDWPLVEDAYACIARKLAGENSPAALRFAFDAPESSPVEDAVVELWDRSLSPCVLATIGCAALRTALELEDLSDAACLRLVRANKGVMTELAERLFAEGRIDERLDSLIRWVNIDVAALRSVAIRLRHSRYGTAVESMNQREAP